MPAVPMAVPGSARELVPFGLPYKGIGRRLAVLHPSSVIMKFFVALIALVASVAAQQFTFITPTPGQAVQAGQNIPVTIQMADSLTGFTQLAAAFGLSQSPPPIDPLSILITVVDTSAPNFFAPAQSPPFGFQHTFFITIPASAPAGTHNLTVSQFFKIGVSGELVTGSVSQPIFISS